MSSGALNAAKAVRGITGPQKCILLLLADHANGEDTAWPSKKTLSEESCLSIRCVRDCLVALEKAGLILRTSRWRKDGSQSSDEITLTLPPPPARGALPPRQESVTPPAPRAPLEPRSNQQDEPTGASLFDLEREGADAPDAFDACWQEIYPKAGRLRSSKAKSLAIWTQLGKQHGTEVLTKAVRNYAASPDAQKDGGQYVPAMERWLRDGRWENWVTAQAEVGLGGLPDW